MKIHEYQAKELLEKAGAIVPKGIVATSPEEAQKAFDDLGGSPVILKAQIHAGGRGKGNFPGSGRGDKFGGVQFLKTREEVGDVAKVMLQYPLVTKQTSSEGQPVSTLLVQEAVDEGREVYLAVVMDRAIGKPVMMGCAEGGVDIEEVAEKSPEKILKTAIDPDAGLRPYQAQRMAYELGFEGEEVAQAKKIMHALVDVFLSKDCSLAEINPVMITPDGTVYALDAKMNFDENALFRHPDIQEYRDESEEDPAELRAAQAKLSFIKLTGNIGCLVNGAGLAMSTMDIIKHEGGDPANFLDVGGGANKDQVTEAFRIILSDENVKAVLVNIFGGIMQCDIIANAVVAAAKEVGFHVPLVVRLEGTNVEQGRKILAESDVEIIGATDLADAAKKVVAAAS